MTEESFERLQELFTQALDIPADRRGTWLKEQCGSDVELHRDVQVLLDADNRTVDPLEAGAAGIVANLKTRSISCPQCQTSWDVARPELPRKLSCPSCETTLVRASGDTVTVLPSDGDDTIVYLRVGEHDSRQLPAWRFGDSEIRERSAASESERLFDAFEKGWNSPDPPDLENFSDFVPATLDGKERKRALSELVKIDLEYRWQQSATKPASSVNAHPPLKLESYFEQLGLGPVSACPIDLIAHEIRVRQWHGEFPSIDEYQARFGALAERAFAEAAALSETQRPAADQSAGTVNKPASSDPASGRPVWSEPLHCPKCNELISIDEEAPPSELFCSSCGTTFVKAGGETVTLVRDGSDETFTYVQASRFASDSPADGTGEIRFGDYELLYEIARGGMGVVYKARQIALNRVVALKMIRAGELAGDEEIQRFHAEAEAAARIDHPNIVPVFEVGEQNGLHFFSMGFVEGKGLDARLLDGPLPPREAAELIRTIAEAVQYAHDKGIVHRDLKPANVLIDANGKPRITDFGLAKNISGDCGMTATGQVLGTPSYMPPEQAVGKIEEIGPLADVYSLGAILYVLLTGRPPFQAANVVETLKQVLDREPVAPSQLNPAVDRDLETISLKCLEKARDKRYASAQHLADELGRYLTHKPILARPVSRWERWRRWCKRNPLGATVAGLVLFLAIAGPAVAALQIETNRQLDEALAGETAARITAQKKEQETAAALKRKNEALLETESSIDAYVQVIKNAKLLKEPRFKPLLKDLLKDALAHYRRFIEEHQHEQDEKTRARMASALFEIGLLNNEKGSPQQAIEAYQQALKITERLSREKPMARNYSRRLAILHNNLGALFQVVGRTALSRAAHQRALKIRLQLVRDDQTLAQDQMSLAESYNNNGALMRANGQIVEAVETFKQALKIRRQLAMENPAVTRYQRELAVSHNNLAIHFQETGKTKEAIQAFQQALNIRRRVYNDNPAVPEYRADLADSHNDLGTLYKVAGDRAEAEFSFQQALRLRKQLAHENPTVTKYQSDLADSHSNLGNLLKESGEADKALAAYQEAVTIREWLARDNPTVTQYQSDLAGSHNNLGILFQTIGKAREAAAAFQQASKIQERLARQNPTVTEYQHDLASSHHNLGVLYKITGKPVEAATAYRKALKIREQLVRQSPTVRQYQSGLGVSLHDLGVLYKENGKMAEALVSYRKALEIRKRLVQKNPALTQCQNDLAATQHNLAVLYSETGKMHAAAMAYYEASKIWDQLVRENPTETEFQRHLATNHNNLAVLHSRTGKESEAIQHIDRAIPLLLALLKRNPRDMKARLNLLNSYAIRALTLGNLSRHCEAADDWRKALELNGGSLQAFLKRKLAMSLARCGQHREATILAGQLLNQTQSASVAYDLACVFAVSANAATRDDTLGLAGRERMATRYAGSATAALKAVATSGMFKTLKYQSLIFSDRDLNSLRHRDDFRKLARSVGVSLPAWARKPSSAITLQRRSPVVAPKPRTITDPAKSVHP